MLIIGQNPYLHYGYVVFEHAFIMNEMRGGQNIILEPEVAG
jgi:hypothetical protein